MHTRIPRLITSVEIGLGRFWARLPQVSKRSLLRLYLIDLEVLCEGDQVLEALILSFLKFIDSEGFFVH